MSVPRGNVYSFCPLPERLALGSQPYEKETPLFERATKDSWILTHQVTADWVLDRNKQQGKASFVVSKEKSSET